MITYSKKIDMYPGAVPAVFHLSQYDDDFELVCTLFSSYGAFEIQSGTTVEIRGTKADGNGYSVDATISGNVVTVTGDKQMTAAAGKNEFELTLYHSGKELNTANFIIDVERAALDADTITSESKIKELVDVLQQADEIMAAADEVVNAIDTTLTQAGKAADAKRTGDEIDFLKRKIERSSGLTDTIKEALLACFRNVAWINQQGTDCYDALEEALYSVDRSYIIAVYEPGDHKPYEGDDINSLKQYMTVTYYENIESTGVIIPANEYTLAGSLAESGETYVNVFYESFKTVVTVYVYSHVLYRLPQETTFDGTSYIDTDFAPFSEDHTFTVLADFTEDMDFSVVPSSAYVIHCMRETSPYSGVAIQLIKETYTKTNTRTQEFLNGGTFTVTTPTADTGHRHIKMAFSHEKGINYANASMSDNGEVVTPDSGLTHLDLYDITRTHDLPMRIGAGRDANGLPFRYFKGTVHSLEYLDYAMSQSECDEYVASSN